ncbi:hypothetical protein Pmar_PMAR019055 [Perkinsus marinus ATCC 50983]|uniref:Uncharacterized protein n=1 Tax=Perkinsus marinus (strain ATCC 50983 / TXsc) TaxID=423536 RepID=C5KTR1_PERM5|nr:hypothetical protein Pmar_PMAR019055 [Perkinsus marinus ATCC 50983]EER11953.1 hypothetical protein Pmar_PMAR019055 [Perkinsus marinus ATCC 50983]|eukprot:XP_002780158.1 hypothetical protein Pmar_PMAR019055 [Perkinsus marinus ATCC 50983]
MDQGYLMMTVSQLKDQIYDDGKEERKEEKGVWRECVDMMGSVVSALRELQGDSKEKEPLALGLELCYGRINRMKFVKSKDIKALWQFSKDNPTTQLHALDVSPGEAAKEVFRDMPLVGIIRVAWYVIMRRLLSPLAERVLLWRILYYPTVERMPVVDEWIMRWRVPTPVMKIIRSMMATASTVDDIRDAIEKKYPPSKERSSYLQDSTLDPMGYIQLCDKYKIDKRLQEVVIDMRDEYMYRALWRLACKHNRVIAVVGENHVKGIHKRWMANDTGKRLSPGICDVKGDRSIDGMVGL